MMDDRRVALGRGDHVLDPVVDELHGPTCFEREERSVPGDHRRILFFAAEPAARLGLNDADFMVGKAEKHLQRPVDVVRALHRTVQGDPAAGGHRNRAVRLDV